MAESSKRGRKGWAIGLGLAAVVVGAIVVFALNGREGADNRAADPRPAASAARSDLARFATGRLARLETPAETPAAPDYVFKTRDGADARFSDFRGRVVVVNLWAMWCAPCRTEMPTLAALAQTYEGRDLVVLPINVDVGEDALAQARSFIDVHEPLPLYTDPKFELPFLFPGKGKMPQTILLDRQGRVRAAYSGEADWNGPEARALIDALLAEPA